MHDVGSVAFAGWCDIVRIYNKSPRRYERWGLQRNLTLTVTVPNARAD